jgi:hypothetical protein
MQLPRFLWVPFPLGRPFGAPHEPDFQRRVLRSALELLERDGPVVLEDFPEDAPESAADDENEWACPIAFAPPPGDESDLVHATLDEMAALAPWHEIAASARGRTSPPASGLIREDVVHALGRLVDGEQEPETGGDLPLHEWVRLGCDDLRTWYLEAAQGQPGRGSASQLQDWFWQDTAVARLVAAAALALIDHPNPIARALGLRAMVPRPYMASLMPGVDPFI